jgi:hypothetical protein
VLVAPDHGLLGGGDVFQQRPRFAGVAFGDRVEFQGGTVEDRGGGERGLADPRGVGGHGVGDLRFRERPPRELGIAEIGGRGGTWHQPGRQSDECRGSWRVDLNADEVPRPSMGTAGRWPGR